MQSVFKVPLALTALHLIERGGLSLDQPIRFRASDRILPQTYSPLQDKHPGAVDDFVKTIGIHGFHLQDGEAAPHLVVSAQYGNWWEPAAAVQPLLRLSEN